LEELPREGQLQQSSDPAWHYHESVRDDHKVVQPREKGAVFVSLAYERVELLFERQLHADAYRAFMCLGLDRVSPFVRRLHDARTTAANDVASHFR
jgi:hypothetical protein